MAAKIASATIIGVEAHLVDVETEVIGSNRRFAIVGLPDGVLREAKDRVRCAIEHSGFTFPHGEVIVNLSPAAIPKRGAGFDLAIALSVLAASGQLSAEGLRGMLAFGELTLDGQLRMVGGELAVTALAVARNLHSVLLAEQGAKLAACVEDAQVVPVRYLAEVIGHLKGTLHIPALSAEMPPDDFGTKVPSLDEVVGQEHAKRAAEIVAAGAHNVLMVGPPGAGKSMLAERLPSLLPPLTVEQSLEVASIHSISGAIFENSNRPMFCPPFRAPHHTTSVAGLVGGGSIPMPGEITLAHRGVLFLDEIAELRRDAMESLRMPLESKKIIVSRSQLRVQFPADCIVVAAMNPCPCGKFATAGTACRCLPTQRQKYFERLSGPIRDRFDLQIWIPPVPLAEMNRSSLQSDQAQRRKRISIARSIQQERGRLNSSLNGEILRKYCELDSDSALLLERAAERFNLSARAYTRILRVARSIADLAEEERIRSEHVAEALSYRTTIP